MTDDMIKAQIRLEQAEREKKLVPHDVGFQVGQVLKDVAAENTPATSAQLQALTGKNNQVQVFASHMGVADLREEATKAKKATDSAKRRKMAKMDGHVHSKSKKDNKKKN